MQALQSFFIPLELCFILLLTEADTLVSISELLLDSEIERENLLIDLDDFPRLILSTNLEAWTILALLA